MSLALLRNDDVLAPNQSERLDKRSVSARLQSACHIAAKHAEDVDRQTSFPSDAIEALRSERLLGLILPVAFGGEGGSLADAAEICYKLAGSCSSSALIYAMHCANLACVAAHCGSDPLSTSKLRRIGAEQFLIASSTTEGTRGADLRSSDCAIVSDDHGFSLTRSASVISYGAAADAILSTARRSDESAATDQCFVLLFKENYRLERRSGWDALGMRGTCSEGFQLEARGELHQILDAPFEFIHRQTLLPATHLLWAACWAGIASATVEKAQSFARTVARRNKGAAPPGAAHITRATMALNTLILSLRSHLAEYERRCEASLVDDMAFQSAINMLKISASETAVRVVMDSLNGCGLAAYRNDGDFSMTRQLRDILSSTIMISNSRILQNVGGYALLGGVPQAIGAEPGLEAIR